MFQIARSGHLIAVSTLIRKRTAGELVFLAAAVIAVILVAHILFILLGTNPANDIVHTAATWGAWLATWFDDMFQPTSEKLEVFINYGLATVFYLAVGAALRAAIDAA